MKALLLPGIALGAIASSQAEAAAIPGLYNTGTDANGLALAGGNGVTDPHWRLFNSSQAVTYYNNAYPANDANSRWVGFDAAGDPACSTGIACAYELDFNLTGFDLSTVDIQGKYATDNTGFLALNGNAVGPASGSYSSFTSFDFSQTSLGYPAFNQGLNSLFLYVRDFGAPSAFRVDDLVGTGKLLTAPVPEPATWAMMIAGLGFSGVAMRWRRRSLAFG